MVPTLHQNLYSLFEKTGIFPIIADHYQTITWYFKMDVYLIICKNRSQANLSTRRQYYMDSKGTSWVLCCISLRFPNYACEDFFCPFFCQYLDSSDNTLLMIVIGFFFINCIKKKTSQPPTVHIFKRGKRMMYVPVFTLTAPSHVLKCWSKRMESIWIYTCHIFFSWELNLEPTTIFILLMVYSAVK